MSIYTLLDLPAHLREGGYLGRGIVVGKTADGSKAAVAYFIMGRSENSRNRVFVPTGDDLMIHPHDPSKVEDPSLIIYAPVRRKGHRLVVTNGDQTDTVANALDKGGSFAAALTTRTFEPDAPNFTPRISAMLTFEEGDFSYEMSILKSADAEGTAPVRHHYTYPALPGVGHFLHTYMGDGKPLPSFVGEPERVAVVDDLDAFTAAIWENLHPEHKISLYTCMVDLATGKRVQRILNRHLGD
ncbi:MAG: IMP cyclohydrolase [Clostridia bacterium]|nr:IMP cyclohydrolase [Clostridia bacterium]